MGHRYPKVSEGFKCLAHNHMLIYFAVKYNEKKGPFAYKPKPRFRYRTFFNLILQEVSRLYRREYVHRKSIGL